MDKEGMEPTPEGRTGDAIRGAAEDAKEELSRLGEEVKEKSVSLFDSQRDLASRQVHSLAQALEVGAEKLEEEGQELLAEYTREAAEKIHHFGDAVRDRELNGVVDNVSRYARDNPAVVIGGAAVFGFLLSRFLKSSSARSHDEGERSSTGIRGFEGGAERVNHETTNVGFDANAVTSPITRSSEPYRAAPTHSYGNAESIGDESIGDDSIGDASGDTRSEGMAPGISPVGESARVEDTRRRFGDGTES